MSNMMPEAADTICELFNKLYPVGVTVFLVKDLGEVVETRVVSPAGLLNNTPIVGLDGLGAWLLSRVIPAPFPWAHIDDLTEEK